MDRQGEVLWSPPPSAWSASSLGRFASAHGPASASSYADVWEWSVSDLTGFWSAVADEFSVGFVDRPQAVLEGWLPSAVWFRGATLNYAEHALRGSTSVAPALVGVSQTRGEVSLTWGQLRSQVGAAAAGLRALGVRRGDAVVGYLPNVPEAVVAFLACASLGAVWSSVAPEFGVRAVVDRVRQVAPKVVLAVDGYVYGDRVVDRRGEVGDVVSVLPSVEAVVSLPYLGDGVSRPDLDAATVAPSVRVVTWAELLADEQPVEFTPVPFDHPLYVLFSSGTTGLPKAIVHGHGGITLEHCKAIGLHQDLGEGDRFLWFTTTGWMMWNYLVSGLLVGATVVTFDGDPGHPDLGTLWRLTAELGITSLGVSAPFLMACRAAGLSPGRDLDLSSLRQVGSTGAPLPTEGSVWVAEHVGEHVQPASVSGGTDVCTAFVGVSPLTEVFAGEISCRYLGAKVEAHDPQGRPVVGEDGELVITAPMPSMPLGLLGDDDGSRYREAYFDVYPGVWRHGDWLRLTERGSLVISGRSDATLNRGGVRTGTAELTAVIDDVDGVAGSLVIHLERQDRLVLFVVLDEGVELDEELRRRIAATVRSEVSPRHVPDEVHRIPEIPRTISGKVMEVPVKRLLQGADLDDVANPGAMANPDSLTPFVELAAGER